MTADCLNAYPDYNKPFKIHTDASDYQLGAAIIQEGRPIAYWSRLLQSNQMKYTTTEKELLAIILCLKEYERILYRVPHSQLDAYKPQGCPLGYITPSILNLSQVDNNLYSRVLTVITPHQTLL